MLTSSTQAAAKPKKKKGDSTQITEALFKKLDADSDGKLTLAEFKKIEDSLPKLAAKKAKKVTAEKPDFE